MCDVLDNINDDAVIERVKGKVLDICAQLPGICVSVSVDIKKAAYALRLEMRRSRRSPGAGYRQQQESAGDADVFRS